MLFDDEATFNIGSLRVRVLHTPGHTPACSSYLVADEAVFVGDTLFAPDAGTARCDFPRGSASTMYASVRRLLALPPTTRMFLCHDYQPGGRELVFETSVAEQRAANKHVKDGVSEAEYVEMRTTRDATLSFPKLLLPSIQVNVDGARLPEPDSNGVRYLRIPVNSEALHPNLKK